jgi:uncharacterized membrane protein YbhN (UPF0104 family)
MLASLIQDATRAANSAAKLAGVSMLISLLAAVALFFIILAAFVWAEEQYGEVISALGLGVFFLVLAAVVFVIARSRRRSISRRRQDTLALLQQPAPSERDAVAMAAGVELLRIVGPKRIVPALALSALILGAVNAMPQAKAKTDQSK